VTRSLWVALGLAAWLWASSAAAQLVPHDTVKGDDVVDVWIRHGGLFNVALQVPWSSLDDPTRYPAATTRAEVWFFNPTGSQSIELPACANLKSALGKGTPSPSGPRIVDLPPGEGFRELRLTFDITAYEHRIACSAAPRLGTRETTIEGLDLFRFTSAHAREGGGNAAVFLPKGHDAKRPSALLVGLHPWNGGIWTYAAYAELLREAQAKDVVLLMPSGLGNSLYTEHAEAEVLTAIDELSRTVAIDPRRVSLWGASMGGAGATTIGFHHPDRFAGITSFFGDSKYDLSTYVKSILVDEAVAHRVNALDVVDNARNVPVWLIHGEKDSVSPIAQSAMLAEALRKRGFAVRFDRVPGMGHEGPLVTRFITEVVDRAALARMPDAPRRVSFVRVGPYDASAYGIRLVRGGARGDASIDLERRDDGIHVLCARGVRAVLLPRGAFGVPPSSTPPIMKDDPEASAVDVRWDDAPSAGGHFLP
jgi:pimeloyl-ACP methyl ester carboxylesterase